VYFAFFYLLFFSVDILLATNFDVLGMMPVHYIVAGVGIFSSFFLFKRLHFFPSSEKVLLFPRIFYGYILVISFFHFMHANSPILINLKVMSKTIELPSDILLIMSGIVFFLSLFTMPFHHSLSRWVLFSAVAGIVRYSVEYIFPYSILLLRYGGVFDFIMLFGWLMVIVTILKMEFAVEA
jgi:hypothetical protein